MFRIALCLFFLLAVPFAEAREREFPTPESSEEYVIIQNLDILQTYYGVLDQYPHTYLFEVKEPTVLTTHVSVPDSDMVENSRSLIVVRQEVRGVSEIARVHSKRDSVWDSRYDRVDATNYRDGQELIITLEAGIYLLEVSTPENNGPYVLSVGVDDPLNIFGYFSTLRDVYYSKKLFGISGSTIIFSPLVYVPLGFIFIGMLLLFVRKKKYA